MSHPSSMSSHIHQYPTIMENVSAAEAITDLQPIENEAVSFEE